MFLYKNLWIPNVKWLVDIWIAPQWIKTFRLKDDEQLAAFISIHQDDENYRRITLIDVEIEFFIQRLSRHI